MMQIPSVLVVLVLVILVLDTVIAFSNFFNIQGLKKLVRKNTIRSIKNAFKFKKMKK